ncbi:MAG: M20/M25/M40 family metallo-hydrolase, partial [Gemmatimonadota bacterium]
MDQDLARPSRTLVGRLLRDTRREALARDVLTLPSVQEAARFIRRHDRRTVDEQMRLASVPAPPFQEDERGRIWGALLAEAGAGPVQTDEVGNVWAPVGRPGDRPLVVSAHLDTVFPPDQDIRIRREGDRWVGPGVSDDARGLAVLLAVVRALIHGPGPERTPVVAVATVGEEGLGDLRGVRHLFAPGGALAASRGFISLDGAGTRRVIASGVGSRRFRVTIRGPGGHSWVDWGRVNPLHILAEGVCEAERVPLPSGCTFNVGRMGGGTSINAIPTGAWAELEFRSEREDHLGTLESRLRRLLERLVRRRNADAPVPTGEGATLDVQRIGNRPAGRTDPDTPLVRAALASTRAVVGAAELAASSTDANYPMHQGDGGNPLVHGV